MKRKSLSRYRNPWVIYDLKSLFGIFGISVCAFFGAQAAAAALLVPLCIKYIDLPPVLVAVSYFLLCLVIDLILFLRLVRHFYTAWLRPAKLVLLLTVLPCASLWVVHYTHLLLSVL